MGCLDHPYFLVRINETSKGFFSSTQGLRQGDPLSLFLFTLVVDAFSALMERAKDHPLLKRFSASRDRPFVSHLQFIDDTICFIDAQSHQVTNLKFILRSLETMSRLKVNLPKFTIKTLASKSEN